MLLQELVDILFEELSGIKAKEHVLHLSHYHRIQASPGFHEAALYIRQKLVDYGYLDAAMNEYPADGKINHWDWESPIAWKAVDAELWLTEPHKEILCDFKDIPLYLIAHSQSAVTVADLVDIGTGTEEWQFQDERVKDAIIMATGPAREIYPYMIKYEVQGLIRYPSDERAYNYSDMIIHDAFMPIDADRDQIPFGFCISKRRAEQLKGLLAQGKRVRVMAKVNAELSDGTLDIVEACLPGSEEEPEEVLFVSHLCNPKPSANDNASGCALLLEIARCLKKLTGERKLSENKRTIRFLWVPEYSGPIAWLHWNYYKVENIVACINLDSVGESPDRIGTPLRVCTPSFSTESFLEDLLGSVAEIVGKNSRYVSMEGSRRPLQYELQTISGPGDYTIFIDNYFNIPSVMLTHDDIFRGTNLDSTENVDATELLRAGLIAAASAYFLVSPDLAFARHLLLIKKAGSLNRINNFFKQAIERLYLAHPRDLDITFYNEVGKASYLIKREELNIDSILTYYDDKIFEKRVDEIIKSVKAFAIKELKAMEMTLRERGEEVHFELSRLNTLPKEYRDAQILIPEKIIQAPFKGIFKKTVYQRIHRATKEWLSSNSLCQKFNVYSEIHNLINGENSIFEIFMALDLQFGNILLNDVWTYVMLLQKMKLINVNMLKREEKTAVPTAAQALPLSATEEHGREQKKESGAFQGSDQEVPGKEAGTALKSRMPKSADEEEVDELLSLLDNEVPDQEAEGADVSPRVSLKEEETSPLPPKKEEDDEDVDELLEALDAVEIREVGRIEVPRREEAAPVKEAPAATRADLDEWDLDSLEIEMKKIVVKDEKKKDAEVKKVIVEDLEQLDLSLEGVDLDINAFDTMVSDFEGGKSRRSEEAPSQNFDLESLYIEMSKMQESSESGDDMTEKWW
ncbi:MAG: DUF4910 domain-containing protein [Candidatus Eremiobacteraeota bacterium]|nr:DUF4910 domain-containing protein [Candidatus Eremiobacteraeota bacterium]